MTIEMDTKAAALDQWTATMTFDAFERAITMAVGEDEMETAAEYLKAMFVVGDQLDDWHDEYVECCMEMAESNEGILQENQEKWTAIKQLHDWGIENEHETVVQILGEKSATIGAVVGGDE